MKVKHHPIQQEMNPESYRPNNLPKLEVDMEVQWRISSECEFKCPSCGLDWHLGIISEGKGTIIKIASRKGLQCDIILGGCGSVFSGYQHHEFGIEYSKDDGFWASATELIPILK